MDDNDVPLGNTDCHGPQTVRTTHVTPASDDRDRTTCFTPSVINEVEWTFPQLRSRQPRTSPTFHKAGRMSHKAG